MLLTEIFQQQARALAFPFLLAEFLRLLSVLERVAFVSHKNIRVFAVKDKNNEKNYRQRK
jgi:hypothetical protein